MHTSPPYVLSHAHAYVPYVYLPKESLPSYLTPERSHFGVLVERSSCPRACPRLVHAIPTPAGVFCKRGKSGPRIGLDLEPPEPPHSHHGRPQYLASQSTWSARGPELLSTRFPTPIQRNYNASQCFVYHGGNWSRPVRFFPYRVKKK